MSDFTSKSATYGVLEAGVGRRRKRSAGTDRGQKGRVANELCHAKGMVNADELARIT